jgi:hypothetical protein
MSEISSDSSFLSQEPEQSILKNIMTQKLDKKRNLNISKEIKKRKKMFDHLIYDKFGRHFLKIKSEAYTDFIDKCKTYYFSPDSKFLNNFPKLKQSLLKEKRVNINYNKLLPKINIGSMLYLSEADKKRNRDRNARKTEKLMTLSKNFTTQNTKDVISNEVYKVKFWNKESKNINKILKNKYLNIFKNFILKNINIVNNDETNNNINNEIADDKNIEEINNLSPVKNKNEDINQVDDNQNIEKIKENKRYNPIISYYNNIPNNNGRKSSLDNINLMSIKTSPNLKESNNKMNYIKDYSFSSLINKTNSLKTSSNEKEIINNIKSFNSISRNSKSFEIKRKLRTSFNFRTKSKRFSNLNPFRYKKNINNKVQDLNSQTKLCNVKLYNLITNNKTVLPGKRLTNSEKVFDINYSLSETTKHLSKWKKNNKGTFSYLTYEKLNQVNSKSLKSDSINVLVKEVKNNMNQIDKIRKRELKLFPKRLLEIKDEYALQLVDKLFSRENLERHRMPKIKNTLKEQREMKQIQLINELRNRTFKNYNKIKRMGFYLVQRKEKFNLTEDKYHRKSYKNRNNDDLKVNNN